MRRLVLAVTITIVGCSPALPVGDQATGFSSTPNTTPRPIETTTTTLVDGVIVTDGLKIIVPPDEDGNLPPDLQVGCWAGPYFPFSALETIEPLETADPGGVVEAIAPFLDGEEGQAWPQDGWLILDESDDEILLVSRSTDGIGFMNVSKEEGSWRWTGSQSGPPCPLYYGTPEDLNPVDWRLDPSAPSPGADTTTLQVLLSERSCVSGQQIGDRLLGPEVVMTTDDVRVAFAAEPPSGEFFTCQGIPETPMTVELPRPIGDRTVVEGLAIGVSLEGYLD